MLSRRIGALGGGLLAVMMAWAASGQTGEYQGALVTRAREISYPPDTRTPGLVTLDVSVDGSGKIQKVAATRDVPPLTEAARSGVNGWEFSPAMKGGQAVPGVARVNVVFNPFNPGDVSIPNKPLPSASESGGTAGAFQPPDVQTANYAVYPVNTVASGTVVLELKVGADGTIAGVRVLGGEGTPLSGAATRAVRKWTFVPGRYEGKAVLSHTYVAFVFVSPALGTQ